MEIKTFSPLDQVAAGVALGAIQLDQQDWHYLKQIAAHPHSNDHRSQSRAVSYRARRPRQRKLRQFPGGRLQTPDVPRTTAGRGAWLRVSVQGNKGGTFYVKSSKGYGRVMVYYVPNMPWIYAESWFNPNPNSRNLEVDPSKVIKR